MKYNPARKFNYWRHGCVFGLTFSLVHVLGLWGIAIVIFIVGLIWSIHGEANRHHIDHLEWHLKVNKEHGVAWEKMSKIEEWDYSIYLSPLWQ